MKQTNSSSVTEETTAARIRSEAFIFRNPALAFSFANGASKPMGVMMGDGETGEYIVTTLANCQRLERMGFEWASV